MRSRRPLSAQDQRVLYLYHLHGNEPLLFARDLGVSESAARGSVYRLRRRGLLPPAPNHGRPKGRRDRATRGLAPPPPERPLADHDLALARAIAHGLRIREVCRLEGCSVGAVHNALRRLRKRFGLRTGRSTAHQITYLIAAYESGGERALRAARERLLQDEEVDHALGV